MWLSNDTLGGADGGERRGDESLSNPRENRRGSNGCPREARGVEQEGV